MGACCTGKENKNDGKNEEVYTKYIKTGVKAHLGDPIIDLEIENTEYTKTINRFINKYSIHNIIKRMNIENLWNIIKYHNDDYTNSEYLLYDFRDIKLRTENFLKKLKMINYSIDQLNILTGIYLDKFKRFIKDKNIIFIYDLTKISYVEDMINFLHDNNTDVIIHLLDCDLSDLSRSNKNIIEFLDGRNFLDLPYILLSLKYFPSSHSENLIFVELIKDSKEFIINQKFYEYYGIETVLNFVSDNIERKKDKGINYIDINLKSLNDIIANKIKLFEILLYIKSNLRNKSCIIQIDSKDINLLAHVLLLVTWKLTDVTPKNAKKYLLENFNFIDDIKNIFHLQYYQIDEFFKKHFGVVERDNSLILLSDLDNGKETTIFHKLIRKLRSEIKEVNLFNNILLTINKIVQNIVDNPGNEKFFIISTESNTFKDNIGINKIAIEIIESLGFKKEDNLYSLDRNINMPNFIDIKNDFNQAMNQFLYN